MSLRLEVDDYVAQPELPIIGSEMGQALEVDLLCGIKARSRMRDQEKMDHSSNKTFQRFDDEIS